MASQIQIKILNVLDKHGAFTVNGLSEMLHSSPVTVNPELKILVRRGIVIPTRKKGEWFKRYKISKQGKVITYVIKHKDSYVRKAKEEALKRGDRILGAITKKVIIELIVAGLVLHYPFLKLNAIWIKEILDLVL